MGNTVKITDLKCPGCGSALKMPAGNAKTVQCEYCGNEYVIDTGTETNQQQNTNSYRNPGMGQGQGGAGAPRVPQWEAASQYNGGAGGPRVPQWEAASKYSSSTDGESSSKSPKSVIISALVTVLCIAIPVGIVVYRTVQDNAARQREARHDYLESLASSYSNTYDPYEDRSEEAEQEATLSGLLAQVISSAFGKDAGSVTAEELAQIRWISDYSDFDNIYIGYSFDDPMENPDAQLTWLTFPSGNDRGYQALFRLTGLKKLETRENISLCGLKGLALESLSASFGTLEEAADALDDPAMIRQLTLGSRIKTLDGLDLFPNLESLTIDAGNFTDVDAVVALGQLKSLTLEDADTISDFSVFAAMGSLEELAIESENLKSLDFLSRMPQLKSLGLADGKLLGLDGIEALTGLEKLTVTDCSDLKNMDGIAALTGLKELELEKPYDCTEPSLSGLTQLRSLSLKGFDACDFLPGLTELEELTLRGCNLSPRLDLSGLTKLTKLTCATFYQDMSLAFVEDISSLEYVNLGGMRTFEDISGIFGLPNIREIKMNGMECEIDFDRVADNPSLETLEIAGVRLYNNVKIYSSMGITDVYYDDVFLADHPDFFGHFAGLKRLDVSDNEIRDIQFAESLVNLEEMDFSDNYVTDMRVLASLPALRLVNCAGNPIGNLRVLDESHVEVISE